MGKHRGESLGDVAFSLWTASCLISAESERGDNRAFGKKEANWTKLTPKLILMETEVKKSWAV